MIYLDNSSTTHRKPLRVKIATLRGLGSLSVNPSRAGYSLAIKGGEIIYRTREKLASYLGTTAEQVIFTSGCTHALNLAILGTAKRGGHIIATIFEHNSVMRTLDQLKNTHNIEITLLTPNKKGLINPIDIQKKIRKNTYMVITNHTSNVTGYTQNIEAIGRICKKNNLIYLVDGAQSVGHEKINMEKFGINLLTIAGHKGLYAPQGIGALLINSVKVSPIIFGGTGTYSDKVKQPTDYPDGLESGTPNLPSIMGLEAGLDFVIKSQDKINKKIERLTTKLIYGLNRIKNITTYGTRTSGVVSIVVKGKDSVVVSQRLSEEYNICTRSGLHCAPLVHKFYGTLKNGMTRISISYFNSSRDISKILNAIEKIALD